MQTFLCYDTYPISVQALDNKRLTSQMFECRSILGFIVNNSGGAYRRHPVTLMWEGHEHSLYDYAQWVATELSSRGLKWQDNMNTMTELIKSIPHTEENSEYPEWYNDRLIQSHRATLYRKDPVWYSEFHDAIREVCCPNGSNKKKEPCPVWYPTHEKDGRRKK